jgi:hypothetical protein
MRQDDGSSEENEELDAWTAAKEIQAWIYTDCRVFVPADILHVAIVRDVMKNGGRPLSRKECEDIVCGEETEIDSLRDMYPETDEAIARHVGG